MSRSLKINGNSWVLYINKLIANAMGITEQQRKVKLVFKNNILHVCKYLESEYVSENTVVKTLIKRGSGYGLVFSATTLELLNINPETDLVDIRVEENKLLIEKAKA